MSDGCIHAGVGMSLNFGWERKDIIEYMSTFYSVGFTAKTLATILLDECNRLYGGSPYDDTTACVIKIRKRVPMNLLFGPPAKYEDGPKMMSLFFSKEGKHIICGGTSSNIAAAYLAKPLVPKLDFPDPNIPPIAEIEGVDLVTEGVITMTKVLEYAKNYIDTNDAYSEWSYKRDGASLICRLLFEEATDINFYVGKAINPAHQNPNLPITFNIKMSIVKELAECLEKIGKRIRVSYF
jgi:hypothetical protein